MLCVNGVSTRRVRGERVTATHDNLSMRVGPYLFSLDYSRVRELGIRLINCIPSGPCFQGVGPPSFSQMGSHSMPAKGNKRYGYLLEDPQITRCYDNVARGSRITADVYLRRFGSVLEEKNLSPQDILKIGQGDLFNLLLDPLSQMEKDGHAGSYTQSVVKAVKSWLQFNHIVLVGRMRIRGTEETPTLIEEKAPSQQELGQILKAAGLREKVAIMLVASGGGRIEILGSYDGSDGLRFRDFPDVIADNATQTVTLQRMPAMFVVRVPISKARHQYFSFLCKRGVRLPQGVPGTENAGRRGARSRPPDHTPVPDLAEREVPQEPVHQHPERGGHDEGGDESGRVQVETLRPLLVQQMNAVS